MNKCSRFLAGLLTAGLIFSLGTVNSRAAEQEGPYGYQVTFYAGNQGTFADAAGIQVLDEDQKLTTAGIHVRADGSAIQVDGLKAGYMVSFGNIQGGGIRLDENSPYYVRGLRESGYDNDEVSRTSFKVTQDQDYVVAYGIKGEMVSYVINYEDASGRTLSPSRTFYGNVGDRPVVAFLYIDGYEPQAYNLTKTLSKNEADNIFTFVYSRVSGGGGEGTTTVVEGAGGTTVVEVPAPEGTGAAGAAGAGGGGGGAGDAGAAVEDPDAGGVNVPDEQVPQDEGPEDLVDLDDEEVPLADRIGGIEEGTANMLGATAVGVTASAALVVLFVILWKRRKQNGASEDGEE